MVKVDGPGELPYFEEGKYAGAATGIDRGFVVDHDEPYLRESDSLMRGGRTAKSKSRTDILKQGPGGFANEEDLVADLTDPNNPISDWDAMK